MADSTSLKRAKRALEPYAQALYGIGESTDKLLVELIDAPKLLTQTNCSWAAYRIAPVVARLAAEERSFRVARDLEAGSDA